MLEVTRPAPSATEFVLPPPVYDWKWMVKSLLRRPLILLLAPLLCAVVAAGYVQMRPSHYTAATMLNITNLRLSSSDQDTFYAEALFDPTFLETQIQIIASEPIARAVLAKANLAGAAPEDEHKAIQQFSDSLSVQRVGQSNLVRVAFTDVAAQPAADTANAIAVAYIEKLRADRESAVQSASSWLRERLRGVGAQAHVVSEATAPVEKSGTRGILIIAMALIAGGIGGAMLCLAMGFLDRRMRDSEQVNAVTSVECLGMVPLLKATPGTGSRAPLDGQFSFASAPSLFSEVERNAFTPLWQTLRSVGAVASRSPERTQRIAVTSTLSGEGKTVIAANYALLAARSGKRVLLVDAQSYDPALSRALAPQATRGLADFLAVGGSDLSRYVLTDPKSGLSLLPFGQPRSNDGGGQLLWSERMELLFEQARDYDLILFDMPPLVATGDLRAATAFIDNFLLVLQWNMVTDTQLRAALGLAGAVRERLIGTVFNQASLSPFERWFSPEAALIARQMQLTPAATKRQTP
ncbi:tyrosine-protein kinase domain-containing protein [Devosia sp. A449]